MIFTLPFLERTNFSRKLYDINELIINNGGSGMEYDIINEYTKDGVRYSKIEILNPLIIVDNNQLLVKYSYNKVSVSFDKSFICKDMDIFDDFVDIVNPICDICSNITTEDVYVVYNYDTKTYKHICVNCLQSYLGFNPDFMIKHADFLISIDYNVPINFPQNNTNVNLSIYKNSIGLRLCNNLTLKECKVMSSVRYGKKFNLFIFVDDEGNKLSWSTQTKSTIEIGNRYKTKFTVKKLYIYDNEEIISINRCYFK